MLRALWGQQALWLDLGWVWEQPFLWLWPSFMQGHGGEERERKKHRAGGVSGASISLWLISEHASPETICSWPKCEAHKDNLTMFLLHFLPKLHSLCLSLWQLIMMSILSYLLGSSWLLISGQHSTATLLVPTPQTTAGHITAFFPSTVACFLLFIVWLPADSRQTKPDQCFWNGSVSTIHFQHTANLY